jgi:aryl-alcohol dehydrogenase-like predicted oxidoreductase
MTAVQIEYSLWTRDVEGSVLDTCRALGIGFVAYSPLGRGFLTGTVSGREDLREGDVRLRMPRFQEDNLPRKLELVAGLRRLAEAERCTPAQLALAWVLSRGAWVVPIAGTSHRRWLEENAAASDIAISAATQQALDEILRPGAAAGARYPEGISRTLGL